MQHSALDVFRLGLKGRIPLGRVRWQTLWLDVLVFAALFGVAFGISEPESSRGLPILAAIVLWFLHAIMAAALFFALLSLFSRIGWSHGRAILATFMCFPVLNSMASFFIDSGFGVDEAGPLSHVGFLGNLADEITGVLPPSLIIGVFLTYAIWRNALRDLEARPAEPMETTPKEEYLSKAPVSAVLPDVPRELGGELIRLQAQDHYVEVVTSLGSALILAGFGECMAAVEDRNGMQCHRSHWVSLDHLREVKRAGSAYEAVLSNGDCVPVSRRRFSALKQGLSAA